MGLDGVELIMALEEAFGVELEDDEASDWAYRTPRSIGDYIFSKLEQSEEGYCLSQRTFYSLRNELIHILKLKRNEVRPDSPLRSFITPDKEKQIWLTLKDGIGAKRWPELARPKWLTRSLVIVSLSVSGATWIYFSSRSMALDSGFTTGVGAAVLFAMTGTLLTRPFKNRIPAFLVTIRDLVPYAVKIDNVAWTRKQVSELVKLTVLEQLDISEEQYNEDYRFIEDYGLDG